MTLLSFICFVSDFNCLWSIFWKKSILFHILRYFHLTFWDIFISVEVLILAFWSYLSNLLLNIFCFSHFFLYFVLFLISTVCELFFSEEVSCFRLSDSFICAVVLVLAFCSDFYSNLFLDMFCFLTFLFFMFSFRYQLFVNYFFSEEVSSFTFGDIFFSAEVLILAFWSYLSNLLLNIFCFLHFFLYFVLFLISTVCELFFSEEVSCFRLWDIFISHFEIFSFLLKYWY